MLILLEMDIIYQRKTFCFDNNFLNLSQDLGTSAPDISQPTVKDNQITPFDLVMCCIVTANCFLPLYLNTSQL